MKYFVVILFLFTLLVPAWASPQEQPDDILFIKKIADNIRNSSSCSENMRYLTKKIGSRLSGSAKTEVAEKWGLDIFKKAGADTVWRQPCKATYWERGGTDSAFISYVGKNGKRIRKRISVLALGSSIGSGSGGVKSQLVRINSFEELDSNKAAISGKIVFFNPRFNPEANPITEYSRLAKYRVRGSSKASEYGAKGVIVRSLTNSIDNFPHVGGQYLDMKVPIIPAVAVSTVDANLLDELFEEGKKIDVEIYTFGKNFPNTTGHNIIGELKGREFPDRIITIGAHLDSWDICEGASDDGTGVVITIELLRSLRQSGYRPRNTIRFVLFADEESGANGGDEYTKIAAEKHENHLFAIESDAGAFAPFSIGTEGLSNYALDKLKGFSSLFKPYEGGDWLTLDAPDISFMNQRLKVPIASLWSDQHKYFKVHHSAADTFENTDISQIKDGAINVAILLYLVEKYDLGIGPRNH